MNAAFYRGNLDMEATKEGDFARMEAISGWLIDEYDYKVSCGDEDTIILSHSYTIKECKEHYRLAKEWIVE